MREGKGFLLVYNITSQSSFDEILPFKDKILRAKDAETVPMYVQKTWSVTDINTLLSVLVGNKTDLEKHRQVPEEAGRRLAEEWKCDFMETSAKFKVKCLKADF